MNTQAQAIRRYIEAPSPGTAIISQLFHETPPTEASRVLLEATKGLDRNVLGYFVFPELRQQLRSNDELFREMTKLAANRKIGQTFCLVLLDFLDDAARARPAQDPYWAALRSIASSASQPANVRTRAIRYLVREPNSATVQVLRDIMNSAKPSLMDAAGHVLASWSDRGVVVPTDIVSLLIQYARSSPGKALRSSGVIRALSSFDTSSTRSALRNLAREIREPADRARFLGAAGDRLDTRVLARLIADVIKVPTAESEWVLRGLLSNSLSRLKDLYDAGHHRQYLYASALVPGVEGDSAVRHLVSLSGSKDRQVAEKARSLIRTLPIDSRLEAVQRQMALPSLGALHVDQVLQSIRDRTLEGIVTELPSRPPEAMQPRAALPPLPGSGFATGLHLGDALYRGLLIPLPARRDHWHTGICLGFTIDASGQGAMQAIMASRPVVDAITQPSASRSFASPTTDVASTMLALFNDFLVEFFEHGSAPWHGPFTAPGLTHAQRRAIAATACTFLHKGITWTFADMVDYKWFSWNGTVADIDETRCDGVVEYSYEKNGVRVCGGENPDLWNISHPFTENVENHNEEHVGDYDPGELCPRIQAGDQGDEWHRGANDTTFKRGSVNLPTIVDIEAYGFVFIFAPSIWFRILSDTYETALIRITVSKDGGPPHFLLTENPYQGDVGPVIVGGWQFREVRANTQDKQFGFWLGKTVDGPNYYGQGGKFLFRLVAVDNGGNVSEMNLAEVDIQWPQTPQARQLDVTVDPHPVELGHPFQVTVGAKDHDTGADVAGTVVIYNWGRKPTDPPPQPHDPPLTNEKFTYTFRILRIQIPDDGIEEVTPTGRVLAAGYAPVDFDFV